MSRHKHKWISEGVFMMPRGPGLRENPVTTRWYECFCGAKKETEQRPGETEKEVYVIEQGDS